MNITESSMIDIGKSVREMAEEAARSATEAVGASINGINQAADTAEVASRQAITKSEEITESLTELAAEVTKTIMEAADSALREVSQAAETAKAAYQQAIVKAEEAAKLAREAAEKAIEEARGAAEAARKISQQAIIRAEEFSKSAKQMAEEAARSARQSADLAIREATGAAETSQAVLRQAASRSEEISNFANELAEQATRSAKEAVESAQKAFQESLSRSINRSEETVRLKEIEEKRIKESKESKESKEAKEAAEVMNQLRQAVEGQPGEPVMTKVEIGHRKPWIASVGTSFKKPLSKSRETEKARSQGEKGREIPIGEPAAIESDKATDDLGGELCQGLVRIMVVPGHRRDQIADFENELRQVENLKVLWTGGAENEGTNIVISLKKPIPMYRVLKELPAVKSTSKVGEKILVSLKEMCPA